MKAYLTSVGETTTQICKEQLERFGFEVVVDDRPLPWIEKYKNFIKHGKEDVLRIDADVILNRNILDFLERYKHGEFESYLMVQFQNFDFYKLDLAIGQPVFYKKEVFKIARDHMAQIDEKRPETSIWRLPEIDPHTLSLDDLVYGIHGFGQDKETIARAKHNKTIRSQIKSYDFTIAEKFLKL